MQTEFGHTNRGETVDKIALSHGALSVDILTIGAVLHSVRLKGVRHDLTIGQGSVADCQGDLRYHGSLIAPVANRITGAAAMIAGQTHRFEANQDNRITLHSGKAGTHLKVWHPTDISATHATLTLSLPDGEGGFPGNRHLTATYSLHDTATLRLDIQATTDAPTIFNAVNHSYWNLDGTPDWSGHTLRIAADRYLPGTPAFTPTGDIADTKGSPYDFTAARPITPANPPLDTCFCLSDGRGPLRDVLWLTGETGITMTVATTEPGIQVYDNRTTYRGLAIEPQLWPDAPNHPGFPAIDLTPDAPYHQTSEWRFTTP
jgi:aldose 1-epimerase